MSTLFLCALLFVVIAFLYSSVGFGGGSSYIALLLLLGFENDNVRLIALICNVLVVLGSSINFYKNDLIPWKDIWPIILLSVPFSFLGGMIQLSTSVYMILTSVALIGASCMLFIKTKIQSSHQKGLSYSLVFLSVIGALIGFISGLIGIGGGIFLAPLLLLLNWKEPKIISATASIFILVNSLAGLMGLSIHLSPEFSFYQVGVLGLCVLLGGQIGNRVNIHMLSSRHIQWITACLVGFVGIRILFLQFYG